MPATLLFESENLTLTREECAAGNYLLADWHGELTDEVVLRDAGAVHTAIHHSGCAWLLNSNWRATGLWTNAARASGGQALPQLYAVGCRRIAWVLSPNTYSLLSAEVSLEHAGESGITIQSFDTVAEARAWLLQAPAA